MRTAIYVVIALILIVFGVLAVFSIGWPFLLTGTACSDSSASGAASTCSDRPSRGHWVFTIGYLLVAPPRILATAISLAPPLDDLGMVAEVRVQVFYASAHIGSHPHLFPSTMRGIAHLNLPAPRRSCQAWSSSHHRRTSRSFSCTLYDL